MPEVATCQVFERSLRNQAERWQDDKTEKNTGGIHVNTALPTWAWSNEPDGRLPYLLTEWKQKGVWPANQNHQIHCGSYCTYEEWSASSIRLEGIGKDKLRPYPVIVNRHSTVTVLVFNHERIFAWPVRAIFHIWHRLRCVKNLYLITDTCGYSGKPSQLRSRRITSIIFKI